MNWSARFPHCRLNMFSMRLIGWDGAQAGFDPFSKQAAGIRRLKMEAGLRRWRLFSVRYAKERSGSSAGCT